MGGNGVAVIVAGDGNDGDGNGGIGRFFFLLFWTWSLKICILQYVVEFHPPCHQFQFPRHQTIIE